MMNGRSKEDVSILTHHLDRLLNFLLLFYIILSPFDRLIPLVTNIFIFTLGIGFLIDTLYYRSQISMTRTQLSVIFLITLTLIMGLINTLMAELPIFHLTSLRTLFLYGIVILVSVRELTTGRRVRNAWMTVAICASTIGYLSVLHSLINLPFGGELHPTRTLAGHTFIFPRTIGVPLDYGSYGILLSIGLAIVIGVLISPRQWFSSSPKRVRAANLILLIGLLFGVYVGQSRSTLVATILTVSVVIGGELFHRYNLLNRITVVTIALLTIPSSLIIGRKIAVTLYQVNTGAVTARFSQYIAATEFLTSNPFFGVGWGYFTQTVTPVGVHNFWLLMGLGIGFPGMIAWIGIFGLILMGGYRLYSSDNTFQTGMGGVILGGLTGVTIELLLYPGLADYVGVFVGLALGALRLRNSYSGNIEPVVE